ncbi:MAG: helix-turn-helix domain-containing protein [Anaerolineales bacterium]|nr:helix-turn-helix domain-containing protein [Anaerolineales bacterium]
MADHNAGNAYQPDLDELISLSKAAELSGLSAGHLRLLVRTGEMWGRKLGRNWFTTEQAVQEYLARGIKPGPKPE